MPMNFSMLQPASSSVQPSTQVVQTPDYAAQNEQGLLSGVQTMQQGQANAAQAAYQQAQLKRLNQLLPGELQEQQLKNAGQGLLNQSNELALQKAQQEKQFRANDLAAFQQGQKQRGTDGGLDAMYNSMASHDPQGALTLQTTRQTLQTAAEEGNVKAITNAGSIVHGIMDTAAKTNKSPLELYKQQYDQIKRVDKNAPKPEMFKNDDQFQSSYVMPTLAMALPYQQQIKAQQEIDSKNNLLQAQNLVARRKIEQQNAINQYGGNSDQAKEATERLQEAQDNTSGEIYGKGLMGNLEHNVASKIGGIAESIGSGVSKIVSKLSGNKPNSNPLVSIPTFNSKDAFQSWFINQSTQVQQDIKENPSKYGLK